MAKPLKAQRGSNARRWQKCSENGGQKGKKLTAPSKPLPVQQMSEVSPRENVRMVDILSATPATNTNTLFPSLTPWLATVVTLMLRVYYVIDPTSWWVLHPDEIFQSVEVAHIELYGYGLCPYEFVPPAKGNNLSHYMLREKTLGMYAMRSPLYPQFFMAMSLVTAWLGFDPSPYMLWRLSHVVVSSSLPLAAYVYATTISRSHDIGCVASLLVSASAQLNLVGSHTLINGFASPFLFLALARTVSVIQELGEGRKPNGRVKNIAEEYESENQQKEERTLLTSTPRLYSRLDLEDRLHIDDRCSAADMNNSTNNNDLLKNSNNYNRAQLNDSINLKPNQTCSKNDHTSGENNSLCSKVEFEVRHKSTTWQRLDFNDVINVCVGFLLALCVYSRPDSAIFVGLVAFCNNALTNPLLLLRHTSFLCLVSGEVLGIAVGILDDIYFYESLLISPINWVKFNVFSSLSSELFGSSGACYYLLEVFCSTLGVGILFFMCVCFFCVAAILRIVHILPNACKSKIISRNANVISIFCSHATYLLASPSLKWAPHHAICICMIVLVYSSFGHKEVRFLHDTTVLFFILASCIGVVMLKSLRRLPHGMKSLVLIFTLTGFAINQWNAFHFASSQSGAAYLFSSSETGSDTNQCLHYISQQSDVSGVFLERNIQSTGSYTMLHQKVPLFFVLGSEFVEFDASSMISTRRKCLLKESCTVHYLSLNSVADVIHTSNAAYLLKRLMLSNEYNYAIVAGNKSFFYPAFINVFSTKTVSVWRRQKDKNLERKMLVKAATIQDFGHNGTVLEYEGEVLKQLGNYHTATTRFRAALKRGHDRATVYASLAFCLHRMGEDGKMVEVLDECYSKFNQSDCSDGHKPKVLNLGSGFRAVA